MTSPFDPDQLLRSANPVDEARLLVPSKSAAAQRLFEKITGVAYLPAPARAPAFRRRWRVYVTSVAAALALGGGVAYAVTSWQPTKRLDVGCYAGPSLTARISVVPSDGRNPVAVCRNEWIAGRVGPGGPPPRLVECILRSGTAAVFPVADGAGDVCRRLGLVPVTVTSPLVPTSVPAVVGLRDRVVTAMSGSCLGAPQAQALVRRELGRAGLGDWSVAITTPFTPARPCASPGFDEPRRRVLIIPTTSGRSG